VTEERLADIFATCGQVSYFIWKDWFLLVLVCSCDIWALYCLCWSTEVIKQSLL